MRTLCPVVLSCLDDLFGSAENGDVSPATFVPLSVVVASGGFGSGIVLGGFVSFDCSGVFVCV